jgi:ADP-heptose:LPS heptosyltransferase
MSLPKPKVAPWSVALWPQELRYARGGRVLVCHQGALGDLILTLPAIQALRAALQPARMELMGHPWILALIHGLPYADAVIDINRQEMVPLFQEAAPFAPEMQQYLRGFAAAFCFSQSDILARSLCRAGIRKTFTLPALPDKKMHAVDYHLASLQAIGIPPVSSSPMIYLRRQERQEAELFLLRQGWDLTRITALHPGAGSRKKTWPAVRFAGLAQALASKGHKILLIQGPADEAAAKEVVAALGNTPYLLVRDLPITQLAALLSHAALFIGNDSGISHLAAALGRPTIALFGPTDPCVWAPRGSRAFWLQGKAAFAPCTGEEQRLLEGIEEAQVMALIREKGLLGDTAALSAERSLDRENSASWYGEKGISVTP